MDVEDGYIPDPFEYSVKSRTTVQKGLKLMTELFPINVAIYEKAS